LLSVFYGLCASFQRCRVLLQLLFSYSTAVRLSPRVPPPVYPLLESQMPIVLYHGVVLIRAWVVRAPVDLEPIGSFSDLEPLCFSCRRSRYELKCLYVAIHCIFSQTVVLFKHLIMAYLCVRGNNLPNDGTAQKVQKSKMPGLPELAFSPMLV